jgi:UDP-N-acetylglucosamine 2-epimerase (non-hydrolysing)
MPEDKPLSILIVVGARPNFMKVAPIIRAIGDHNARNEGTQIRNLLVHTGQHYDALMSDQFFIDLDLPKPDVHLGIGSGSQALQTAQILEKFEQVIARESPDIVVVVGDVNSTLACALATVKHTVAPTKSRPLIAHVEAGLRSFDRAMPEEINRIVTDHLADLLFVTEKSGVVNLRREGIHSERVFLVGNTMIDSVCAYQDRADESHILDNLELRPGGHANGKRAAVKAYGLLTLHRPSNVDDLTAFQKVLEGLTEVREQIEIIFPVHPRTRKRIEEFGLGHYFESDAGGTRRGIRLIEPLGYLDFLCLMKNARMVLTDSGGVQEETTCLGVPCVTLRENTERPVTVTRGTNIIGGTSAASIREAVAKQMVRKARKRTPEMWDGKAAERIVSILASTKDGQKSETGELLVSKTC